MYIIQIEERAENFLKKLSKKDAEIILKRIYSIRDNPFCFLKRFTAQNFWRLRIGDCKVILVAFF